VATISHSFEPPKPGKVGTEQTFLDPILPQSPWSAALLEIFVGQMLPDEDYRKRLLRHYALVKAVVADPSHPGHRHIRQAGFAGANDPAMSRQGATIPPPPRRGKRRRRWQ